MRNLNEGKKKSPSYMAELAEIDKQSAVVAMESKINHLQEMADKKKERLSMVSEDENLSELIDKKRVKMMEREIKEIERAKMKLEKLYEKMTGSKKKEMVDEEMDDKINPGNTEDDQAKKDDYDYDTRPSHMKEGGYGSTTYEEDDSTYEEDDMKESTNEEYNKFKTMETQKNNEFTRWQKLAGVSLNENELNEQKYKFQDANDERVKLLRPLMKSIALQAANAIEKMARSGKLKKINDEEGAIGNSDLSLALGVEVLAALQDKI